MAEEKTPQFRLTRPSASADASRESELVRLRSMTPFERVLLSLQLGQLCEQVLPHAADEAPRDT